MVSNKVTKCINTIAETSLDSIDINDRLTPILTDNRGCLYRISGTIDALTGQELHLYLSRSDEDFQRIGNMHQLRTLYMGEKTLVSQQFISKDTLRNIYDMLLDKEDWKEDGGSLHPLKSYIYALFCFYFKYRNNNNIIGFPKTSSVLFSTRLLSSSGSYIYLLGTIKNGCLVDTNLINPAMYEILPSMDIDIPELSATISSISMDTPHKIPHMKDRLERAGTTKDVSEFIMQLKSSIDLIRELRKTSPFVVLPGYSLKLNEINLLVPYFESLKNGLTPTAYIPLRRSEDGIYRPQTVYSLDITRRIVRLFGYTHISGGVLACHTQPA